MTKGNLSKSLGEISKNFLILGGIIIAVIVIVVVVINMTGKPPPSALEGEKEEKTEEPVYEVVVGDIRFKLEEAKNRGNILKVPEDEIHPRDDLATAEKFIEVTITAENVGKENTPAGDWKIEELIDSEERIFYSSKEASPWVPEESKCGISLKPGFTPTLCTKIYEVAKISTDLRVRVSSRQYSGMGIIPGQTEDFFIDLGL